MLTTSMQPIMAALTTPGSLRALAVGMTVLVVKTLALSTPATAQPPATSQVILPSVNSYPLATSSGIALSPATVSITTNPSSSIDWVSLIERGRAEISRDTLPKPQVAKAELQASLDRLNAFLRQGGVERHASWTRFLMLDSVQTELAKQDASAKEIAKTIDVLTQIEKNARQNYTGLELNEVAHFRKALTAYVESLRYGVDPDASVKYIDSRLEALAKLLKEPQNATLLETQSDFGLIANLLNTTNQAPSVLQAIKGRYSKPTARVLASSEFIQRAFHRPVAQPTPVSENILGTRLTGNSFLSGNVAPVLVKNDRAATIQLQLRGQFTSKNIGVNRGVTVHTSSNAGVSASETIQLTDHGLVTLNDTSVGTTFQSHIDSIQHRFRFVRRIATRKAAEQKPQADAIGRSRLESRLRTQFHSQLSEQVAESSSRVQPPALPVLARLGLNRPERRSWSSEHYLSLLWSSAEGSQLAAEASCPLVVQPSGITAQVHQSMLINYLDSALSGRVIRSKDLLNYAKQFGVTPSAELIEQANDEPWAISLAVYHPIEIEFDKEFVTFHIRTTKFQRGKQELKQNAIITAKYRLQVVNGAIQMYREGDVDIKFSGNERGMIAVTLRSIFKKKFDTTFKEQLFERPLRPTDRIPAEFPPLSIVSMQADQGWLQVHLN